MKAPDFLNAALSHMKDRAATYDRQSGERSMSATVEAFKAISGHDLTEEQGLLFMAILKAVRSQQGQYKADSYEDGAAYFALAGEAAAFARGSMPEDFGQKNMMEWPDENSPRQQLIEQGGEMAEAVYPALDALGEWQKSLEDLREA